MNNNVNMNNIRDVNLLVGIINDNMFYLLKMLIIWVFFFIIIRIYFIYQVI